MLYPKEKPLRPTAKHIEVQAKEPTNKTDFSKELAAYDKTVAPVCHQLALLGLMDKEIAETFGVTKKCFLVWQETHKELRDVLNDARNLADARVANALYQRAVGYNYTEDKTYFDRETGSLEIVKVEKHCIADVTAQKAWLQSRRPKQWREAKDLNVIVKPQKKLTELFDDYSDDDDEDIIEGEIIEDDDPS